MQGKENQISVSCLPGRLGDGRFCVEPNGRNAFIFDFSKISFIQLNLSNGRQTSLRTEFPNRIGAPQDWCCIHAVTRYAIRSGSNKDFETQLGQSAVAPSDYKAEYLIERTFILALILENDSNKFFIVSFAVEDGKAVVIQELYTSIDNDTKSPIFCSFFEDEKRQIYCFIYWNNVLGDKSVFHAFKVNISDKGRLLTDVLCNTRILDGNWFHPFVFDDAVHWLPRNDTYFTTLLEVSLLHEKKEPKESKVFNEHSMWMVSGSRITLPVLIYGNAVFYASNEKQKSSQLCYFDCKRQCWQKVTLEMNDHVICGARTPLKSVNDGRLCLHGACSNAFCTVKAHIYVFDIRKVLEKNAARWDESEIAQQPSYELKKLGQDLLSNAQYLLNEKRLSSSIDGKSNGAASIEMINMC